MAGQTVCPRCGARDSFIKGYLPETCVCRICQSQLDWREIPGCGPDCTAATAPGQAGQPAAGAETSGKPGSVGPTAGSGEASQGFDDGREDV